MVKWPISCRIYVQGDSEVRKRPAHKMGITYFSSFLAEYSSGLLIA